MVSRPSTEAEYRVISITTAELYCLRMLFKELCIPLPTGPLLWCDNVSALALASNPLSHAQMKYIKVDYHFVCKKVFNQDILVDFIYSTEQIADLFTKDLSSAQFLDLKFKLMVCWGMIRWLLKLLKFLLK